MLDLSEDQRLNEALKYQCKWVDTSIALTFCQSKIDKREINDTECLYCIAHCFTDTCEVLWRILDVQGVEKVIADSFHSLRVQYEGYRMIFARLTIILKGHDFRQKELFIQIVEENLERRIRNGKQ